MYRYTGQVTTNVVTMLRDQAVLVCCGRHIQGSLRGPRFRCARGEFLLHATLALVDALRGPPDVRTILLARELLAERLRRAAIAG